ncbi:MAG: ribosomal L7Ae/L30e/S12e/Gadd45 family protein [Oscillospiraceae bacterium]|nr:ribosomal L7Ae/L30e/S12e/Gadd45 family protein [Oscillospiraceae bacterium]
MLSKLPEGQKVAGAKQTGRAIAAGKAAAVYLAGDAEARVTAAIEDQARQAGVPVYQVPSMKELGRLCGISVGAAVAAILQAPQS